MLLQYLTLIALPWLLEHARTLCYMYIACLILMALWSWHGWSI